MWGKEEFFKPPLFYLPAFEEGAIHVFNTQKGRIMSFDGRGRFLNAFGSYGNGPGEFSKAHEKVAKVFEDSIYVLEIDRRSIGVYDKGGQFYRSVRMPTYVNNFAVHEHGFLVNAPRGTQPLLSLDQGGNTVAEFGHDWNTGGEAYLEILNHFELHHHETKIYAMSTVNPALLVFDGGSFERLDSVWIDNYPRLQQAYERRVERWSTPEFKERANQFSVNTKIFSTVQFHGAELYLVLPDYPMHLVAYKMDLSNLRQKIWGTDTLRIADSPEDAISVTGWAFRFKDAYLGGKEASLVRYSCVE